MALLARRGRFDPAAVSEELARAAGEAAAGQPDRARKRYAKLAKSLASGPAEARGAWGAALAGQAALAAAAGEGAQALALYAQAFPLVADPARELPREALRELASARMAAPEGSLAAPLAFLRATAAGAVSADEAQAVAGATAWLQQVCGRGQIAVREDACGQAVAGLPGRDWPLLASAAVLVEAGREGEAERLLAGASPGAGGEVWFRWAAILYTGGRLEQAVTGFDEALRRGATGEASPWARGGLLGAECLLFRGMARQRLGQDEAARADLVAAVAHAPADPRPRDAVARLALKLGADHVAREQFGTVLSHTPGYLPALLGMGWLEERAGNFPAAAAQYQAAVTAAPDSWPARVRWGAALTAAGRPGQAVEVLRPLADGAGSAPAVEAAYQLGAALFASGDAAGALACWESVAGDAGEELAAHRAAARDRVARGLLAAEPGRAREAWQKAVAEHPLPAYRAGLREAALREAAFALLAGRDTAEGREVAAQALECARLPAPAAAAADAVTVEPEATQLAEGLEWAGRVDRLASMLALARDEAAGVYGQLGLRAGIRERCHAAAGLLLTDKAKQGALLLAEVPQDPAGDAMLARLRALVAERAGNWRGALDWHLRFLTVPAPSLAAADGPGAGAPGAVCTASGQDCGEAAALACGACGREGCAAHVFRVEGSGSARCARCAAAALAAVLACAAQGDALEEAVPVLAAWAAQLGALPAAAGVRRGLALARGRLGELDEALALLADADTADPAVAAELSALLVRRAAIDLRENRATRAAADLRRAVDLTPGHAAALAALVPLAEHEAWGHASEERWRQAFEAYIPLLRTDPAHPRLLHAVGVTGYRLAAAEAPPPDGAAPAQGQVSLSQDAERVWGWTLAALTAALYLPDLWAATAQAVGRELEPGQVGKARAALVERLRTDLRALDRAAGRDGEEIDAWTVRLGMEVRCAEAFAQEELHIALGAGPARRLVLGPGLRRLLTAPEQAPATLAEWQERYAAAVRPFALASARPHETESPAAGSALTEVFGLLHRTLGPHRYLMLQGRFAAAITALEALAQSQRDGAYQALLAEAQTGLGEEQYRGRAWPEALHAFSRAAKLAPAGLSERHVKMAADAGLYASRELLGEHETRDDQEGAVDLLELAAELAPQDRALRAELGAAYAQLARKTSNEKRDYETALELLRKAEELAPEDRLARDFMRVVLGNLASKLTDDPAATHEQLQRAAELWHEAVVLDPDPKVKSNLSYTLGLLARHAALAGDRLSALELMIEAVRNDPENRGEIAAEAARRMSVVLANYALDDLKERPFAERAEALRRARSFDDSPEVRRVMCGAWRAQAVARFEAKRMDEAELLLQEAVKLAVDETSRREITEDLVAVYRSHAVQAANARRITEAKTTIGKAVALAPGNRDVAALKRSIDAMR